MLAPAATVTGPANPAMLYPVPLTLACEIASAAVPVFVTVTVWLADVFTVWFPNPTALGVTLISGVDSATPVPFRVMVTGVLVALLLIEILADAVPAFMG